MKGLLHNRITKKGFTMAELLIVVAILAILVAVSIPVFTSKLGAAKKATDEANVRACKAIVVSCVLSDSFSADQWTKFEEFGTDNAYFAYYDAEKGCLVSNNTDIKGYGQGSDTVGDTNDVEGKEPTFAGFSNNNTSKKGSYLYVTYSMATGKYYIMWIDPS